MIRLSAALLIFVALVVADDTDNSIDATPAGAVDATTKKPYVPEDPAVTLKRTTSNWKIILGNYGAILGRLKTKCYDADLVRKYGEEAIPAGIASYDKRTENITNKDEIKQIFTEELAKYPDNDWNVTLVDRVRTAIESVQKETIKVVDAMTKVFGSMIAWREDEEKRIRAYNNEFYECINHEYQGLIRGFDGECDNDAKMFWERCYPLNWACRKKFNGTAQEKDCDIDCKQFKNKC